MSATSMTDRIEKTLVLQAPLEKAWAAIGDAEAFGRWFGVDFSGREFVAGQRVSGMITAPGWEHVRMDVLVERVEPRRLLAFRWHPGAPDPEHDYSGEPETLVEFMLEAVTGRTTRLTVTESGFDALPPERYADAYRGNEEGWGEQMRNIERYVGGQ